MGRGGEPGHIHPDLGDDHAGCGDTDAGDLIETCHGFGERGDLGVDPLLGPADIGFARVDVRQHLTQQECVVIIEVADECILQLRDLDAHPGPSHLREHLGSRCQRSARPSSLDRRPRRCRWRPPRA